jgi:hypothetical protein
VRRTAERVAKTVATRTRWVARKTARRTTKKSEGVDAATARMAGEATRPFTRRIENRETAYPSTLYYDGLNIRYLV